MKNEEPLETDDIKIEPTLPLRGGLDFWEYVRGSTKSTLETDDIKIEPTLPLRGGLDFWEYVRGSTKSILNRTVQYWSFFVRKIAFHQKYSSFFILHSSFFLTFAHK